MSFPRSGHEHVYKCHGSRWEKYKDANNCFAYAVGSFQKSRPHKSIPGGNYGMSTNFSKCGWSHLLKHHKGIEVMKNMHAPCKRGFYKVVSYTSPAGDFHWSKQHTKAVHVLMPMDSIQGIVNFYWNPKGNMGTKKAYKKKIQSIIYSKFKRRVSNKIPHSLWGKKITIPVNMWSHKRGWATPPLLIGYEGKPIFDPRKPGFNYPGMNYSNTCKAYQVKEKGVVVGPRPLLTILNVGHLAGSRTH
jgi:hypothetical protein